MKQSKVLQLAGVGVTPAGTLIAWAVKPRTSTACQESSSYQPPSQKGSGEDIILNM